jgi:hypothetical protein
VCRRSMGWRGGEDDEKNQSLGDMRAAGASNTSDLGPNGYSDGASSTATSRGGRATSRCRIRLDQRLLSLARWPIRLGTGDMDAASVPRSRLDTTALGPPRRWMGIPQRILEMIQVVLVLGEASAARLKVTR